MGENNGKNLLRSFRNSNEDSTCSWEAVLPRGSQGRYRRGPPQAPPAAAPRQNSETGGHRELPGPILGWVGAGAVAGEPTSPEQKALPASATGHRSARLPPHQSLPALRALGPRELLGFSPCGAHAARASLSLSHTQVPLPRSTDSDTPIRSRSFLLTLQGFRHFFSRLRSPAPG